MPGFVLAQDQIDSIRGSTVTFKNFSLRLVAAAALLGLSGVSQAALTVYTTEASFNAAVMTPGTDTFDDLGTGNYLGTAPLSRTAGSYGYNVTSDIFTAGSGGDPWLSTNAATDVIVFDNFGAGVKAAGGLFFGSNFNGQFLAGQSVKVVATDASGSSSQTLVNTTTSTFLGFVSTGAMISLTVESVGTNVDVWPAVNNIVLASAVPEPETYALMLAGLGLVGFLARRRRA